MKNGENDRTDYLGIERCNQSCGEVCRLMTERPWVTGEVIESKKYGVEDRSGIDMFVPVDTRLADLLCLEQDKRGLTIQIKSSTKKENGFRGHHKEHIFNLAAGENIFVLNGQEDEQLILASLVGQMVLVASLTGTVPEDVLLGFIAEDLRDFEAVSAYIEHKEWLIEDKWFGKWLGGRKSYEWK